MGKNEIVLFESSDGVVSLPVSVEADTVMIAESKPQEKELMVNLVMTFLK